MNESDPTIQLKAWLCLAYLDHALAGDFDSCEPLSQLKVRCLKIAWDDPSFRAASDMARGRRDEPALPEISVEVVNYALLQALADTEEQREERVREMNTVRDKLKEMIAWTVKMNDLGSRMRERLRDRGDDLSDFPLPEPIKP